MKDSDFRNLLRSIDEAREIHQGKRKPSRVFKFEPLEVKKIREKFKISQPAFATMIGVSVATLRNWEQGRTVPEGAARSLLMVAQKQPKAVMMALHQT